MLGAAQTDTLSAELAGYASVAWGVGVCANVNLCIFFCEVHDGSEVAGEFSVDSRNEAVVNVAGATVERNPIAFFIYFTAHFYCAGFVVNLDFAGTRNAAFADTASHNCSVRCHTATGCEDALSNVHTAEVFGRSLEANHDDFFLAFSPSFSVVGKEYDLTCSGTWRSRETLCNELSRFECGLVEYGVEEFVEFLWFHAAEHCFFVDNAGTKEVHCDFHHSGTCALAVTCLEQPELTVLDSELEVLHIFIVVFELLLSCDEVGGTFRH